MLEKTDAIESPAEARVMPTTEEIEILDVLAKTKEAKPHMPVFSFTIPDSSFILLLVSAILSTGLFFSVIIITLWQPCPLPVWLIFFTYALLAPLLLIFIALRLLMKMSRAAGTAHNMTLREY